MQSVTLKLKQASAVLGVPPKDLQNLVQLGVIRPARRNSVCWFDTNLLLKAKVAFYLKESLGTSSDLLARFTEALSQNLGKLEMKDLRDICLRSRPLNGTDAVEIKIPIRSLAQELRDQLPLASAYKDLPKGRKRAGWKKDFLRSAQRVAADLGDISEEQILKTVREYRSGRKKLPEITVVARTKKKVETTVKINDLIRESWLVYRRSMDQPFLVKPSIPILFFGDSDRYFSSELRVITLGLNPSRIEFPDEDRFLRFNNARKVYPRILEGASHEDYLQALNGYFHAPPNHPYEPWFNSFEHLLNGLDCSYYGNAPNTVLHTDLCSPLATDPTWSKLSSEAQIGLMQCGTPLWHSLVEWLSPDLIIASVARSHLRRISFRRQDGWNVVHTVERANRYDVELTKLTIDGKTAGLVFGKAANTPFGTVSNIDKHKIGLAIKNHIHHG